ncbi:unnamed protein product [Effrenium voratum]|nr:unnamed protein product [Effrenium voratum]
MPREIQGDERSRRNQKDFRKRLAEETLQILQQGWYISEGGEHVDISEPLGDAMVSSFELREDQAMPPRSGEALARMAMEVTGETSLEALYRLSSEDASNLAVLNFASAKNPGGGFLGGAQAQEESLARSSGLFPCLEQFKEFMTRSGLHVTTQSVRRYARPFFRDDEGVLAEQPLLCSVCTSAAPNASQAPHGAAQAAMQADLWVGSRGGSWGFVAMEQLRACFPDIPSGSTSWEHKAATAAGQETSYRWTRSTDLEDDDTRHVLKIGSLELRHDEDQGRDFAKTTYSVKYQDKVVCSAEDARARAGRFNKPMAIREGTAGDVDVVLAEVAALEGLSVEELVASLPTSFGWVRNMPGQGVTEPKD